MDRIGLSLACGTYDRTIPLQDGSVAPDGIDVDFIPMASGELFRRQARSAEFDVAEFSLSTYCILKSRGDTRLTAIPVFTSRRFRHSHIYVNKDLVGQPSDLIGQRIGCAEYQNTATTWIRGILKEDHGVDPSAVQWVFGGLNSTKTEGDRIPLDLPSNLDVTRLGPGQSLNDLLARGEIAAIVGPRSPNSFGQDGSVDRLFPDYEEVEKAYYRRTRIFPIMHTVVIKTELCEQHPWIATALMAAFEEAKAIGASRLRHTGALYCSLPWLSRHLEETDRIANGQDLFAYGVEANRHVLATFLGYALDHGLLERVVTVEELFASATM